MNKTPPGSQPEPQAEPQAQTSAGKKLKPRKLKPRKRELPGPSLAETGGPKGPEPTRYGDWERGGRAIDF